MNNQQYSRSAVLAERRRTRKRRRIMLAASVALAGVALIGSTVAWIAAQTNSVQNTFVPTEVSSELNETFENNVKKNVSVSNTGSAPSYVRVAVIATWIQTDEQGNQVSVLPDVPAVGEDYTLVMPEGENNWVRANDGYYYYKLPVDPGAQTEVLFSESEVLKNHEDASVRLSLEFVVSSIQSEPADVVYDVWGVAVDGDGVLTPGAAISDRD